MKSKKNLSFSYFLIFSFFYFLISYLNLFILLSPVHAAEGSELYQYWCSQCHGIEGRGDGVNSTPDMLVNPRDHTDAAYMSSRTDIQLEEAIRGGGASVSKSAIMPAWEASLTRDEIKALVSYLRQICKCKFEGVISDEKLRKIVPDFR